VGGKEISVNSSTQKINIEDIADGIYTIVLKEGNNYLYTDKLIIIKSN
jgi:hypothetical protein